MTSTLDDARALFEQWGSTAELLYSRPDPLADLLPLVDASTLAEPLESVQWLARSLALALVALCGVRRVAALGLPGVASWSQLKAGVLTLARDRVVVVATDADKAGDDAAKLIAADLAPVARLVRRERPGGKDWAEMLGTQIATRGAA